MEYKFTPIDFPDYADLTYKDLRPLLFFGGKPPIGAFAEVLRSTLSRKDKKLFDKMTSQELYTLVDSYVELSLTREDVMDEHAGSDYWGDST